MFILFDFENLSQALFTMGGIGYSIAVPLLRFIATLLMALSTYKLLKARGDKYKWAWILAMFILSPVLVRIAYEIFRRFIVKSDVKHAKGSTACLLGSVAVYVLSLILVVAAVISMGFGFIRSVIMGEPLTTFYDRQGNQYEYVSDVVYYDEAGNIYTRHTALFRADTITDQNGNSYDLSKCYISEDGYFFYDEKNILRTYENDRYYCTDGETVYFDLIYPVYWKKDGTMWYQSGRFHLALFDFE